MSQLGDVLARGEPSLQPLDVAEHPHVNRALDLRAGADLRDRADGQQPALLDDADRSHISASSVRMCELMSTALPASASLGNHLAQLDAGPRIEPGRRLVEHQHRRVVDHRAAQAQPLLHALRQAVDRLVRPAYRAA